MRVSEEKRNFVSNAPPFSQRRAILHVRGRSAGADWSSRSQRLNCVKKKKKQEKERGNTLVCIYVRRRGDGRRGGGIVGHSIEEESCTS